MDRTTEPAIESPAADPVVPSAPAATSASPAKTALASGTTGTLPPRATQQPPPPPGNVRPCKTTQLSIRVIRQTGKGKAKAGLGIGLVSLTNTSANPCGLSGWPTVGLTRAGTAVAVPTTNVNAPRRPTGMILTAQRTAFAAIQWRGCPATATGCRSGDGFRIGAPGSIPANAQLAGFSATEQKGFGVSTIVVGSIQPTTTDIVNW
ncbi:DUF4232 domain-containing protein [Cryptosporangium aurantiacum]|uniref:DUF4232 domain-containing protein n=1 Tax=Cryptosporangium aurantiacum TaxID=134849 RepID=UPI0015BBF0B6|nr:DUF4232 domain-containing protein [Cryptosporangium aurantiacum]